MKPGTVILAKGTYQHKDGTIKEAELFEGENGSKFFYVDKDNILSGVEVNKKVNDRTYYYFQHDDSNFIQTIEGIHCTKCETTLNINSVCSATEYDFLYNVNYSDSIK